jgi:hypothetical protein
MTLRTISSALRKISRTYEDIVPDVSDDFEDVDIEPSRNDDVAIHDDDFE